MYITAEEFLVKTGLKEPMGPGMVRMVKHKGEKPGTSYTVKWDWKTSLDKIRVEVIPGLSGEWPAKKDLKNFALWLQTPYFMELDLKAKETKH